MSAAGGSSPPRLVSPAEAAALVTTGSRVAIESMSGEPLSLTSALWARADLLRDVTVITGMLLTGYGFLESESPFSLLTWFAPGVSDQVRDRGRGIRYLPWTWSQVGQRLPDLRPDVAFVQVAPADRGGYHSFGSSASLTAALIRSASTVVAEVNPRMPRTAGPRAHWSEFDVIVEATHELPELGVRPAGPADEAVAGNAIELVPDGATLQLGLGSIPEQAARMLAASGVSGLRLHSLLNEGARQLILSGSCTKEPPQALAGELLGGAELYDWSDQNPSIRMASADETHGLAALQGVETFVALNSALEVDLLGQVNSEFVAGRQVGGIGGSLDFAIGAQHEGARLVIALRSTTSAGSSRIVPILSYPPSIPRSLTQFVVTEHGMADLRQGSVEERARALIRIAAPQHREELQRSLGSLLT